MGRVELVSFASPDGGLVRQRLTMTRPVKLLAAADAPITIPQAMMLNENHWKDRAENEVSPGKRHVDEVLGKVRTFATGIFWIR